MSKSEELWRKTQELRKRSLLRSRLEKNLMAQQFKRAERYASEYRAKPPKKKPVGKAEFNPLPAIYQGPLAHNRWAGRTPQHSTRAQVQKSATRRVTGKQPRQDVAAKRRGLKTGKSPVRLKFGNRSSTSSTPAGAYKRLARMGAAAPRRMSAMLGGRGGALSSGGSAMAKAYRRVQSGYRDIR